MFILLQKKEKNNPLAVEEEIIKQVIIQTRTEYLPAEYADMVHEGVPLKPTGFPKYWKDAVPIGSIEFVGTWLKIFHDRAMHPIEIPECLRRDEFLKREYRIVTADKIPRNGKWFVKDVSELKSFNSNGVPDIQMINIDMLAGKDYAQKYQLEKQNNPFMFPPINPMHLFQVSAIVPVEAEFRVYFINGEIVNICQYNGAYSMNLDIRLIEKANLIYSMTDSYPLSYTMDVMVSGNGTSIIEIHPFACIGLYSTLWGNDLLRAYRHGIDYYIHHGSSLRATE